MRLVELFEKQSTPFKCGLFFLWEINSPVCTHWSFEKCTTSWVLFVKPPAKPKVKQYNWKREFLWAIKRNDFTTSKNELPSAELIKYDVNLKQRRKHHWQQWGSPILFSWTVKGPFYFLVKRDLNFYLFVIPDFQFTLLFTCSWT